MTFKSCNGEIHNNHVLIITKREKKVINEEYAYLEQINSDQSEKLQELTESLSDLTRRETDLIQNNMRLAEENRSLYERLSR